MMSDPESFPSLTATNSEDSELKMEGSLTHLRDSACGYWALIKQSTTRDEKWVKKTVVNSDGILIAFYDADSTYLPESEKDV